jgi:phage recombination protein Bet
MNKKDTPQLDLTLPDGQVKEPRKSMAYVPSKKTSPPKKGPEVKQVPGHTNPPPPSEVPPVKKEKAVAVISDEDRRADKLVKLANLTREEILIIKNTVAKGTTDTELGLFLATARAVGLNPMLRQVWCYKDARGNLIIFTGRDGFLTIAQRDPRWNGIFSQAVYSKDTITMDVVSGTVSHSPEWIKDRGQLMGAYCITRPKGVEISTVEYAELKTYDRGATTWSSHKEEMIKKVAEVHALKKAYGIGGLYIEEEFNISDGVVQDAPPVITERPRPVLTDKMVVWKKALKHMSEGQSIEEIEKLYVITPEIRERLLNYHKEEGYNG